MKIKNVCCCIKVVHNLIIFISCPSRKNVTQFRHIDKEIVMNTLQILDCLFLFISFAKRNKERKSIIKFFAL